MRRVIVTADDFGLSPAVNAAIEQAHRQGILTSTSLMVGARAAGDAIERARRLPSLKVGLHLVVVSGRPVLPAEALPDLVDANGYLSGRLLRAGARFFLVPRVRRQLEAEMRAQFEAFRATGLCLDHVDAHHHMHLHPSVFALLLEIGADYGLGAVRVPYEPLLATWRGAPRRGRVKRFATSLLMAPWVRLMAYRLSRTGLFCNDYLFGLHDSGGMTRERVMELVAQLPIGVSELYFHPALESGAGERPLTDPAACAAELAALLSIDVRECLDALDIQRISFSEADDGASLSA